MWKVPAHEPASTPSRHTLLETVSADVAGRAHSRVTIAFESFPLSADPSQSLLTYTAEPGSPSQHALRLLASWAATTHDIEQPAGTDDSEQAESVETPD